LPAAAALQPQPKNTQKNTTSPLPIYLDPLPPQNHTPKTQNIQNQATAATDLL
jgi:hypothetical protein